MGCCWLSLCFAICIIPSVPSEVILSPPTNAFVPVCLGGSASIMCSTTERALVWIIGSESRLLNSIQPDEPLGNLTLSVQSAVVTGSTLTVNSTATVNNFKASLNNTLVVCSEFTTNFSKQATFVTAGPPPAPTVTSITQINSSALLISWSMSVCAVQYVVTIINSSDGSVYLNITTSDTNTTVTPPTGVEYCVTVLGVDIINRTGPPSQQQCPRNIPSMSSSITIISSSIGSTTLTSTPSPTLSVDPPPLGVIAGVVIAVVVIFVLVLAVVAVLVIVHYLRRRGYGELPPPSNKQESVALVPVKCVCQMYYQKHGLNHWKVVFVFVSSEDRLESVKMFYKDYEEYGSPIDCYWKSSDTIQVKVTNKPDGWTVITSDDKVHKATIDGYTGEGSPPHIEMMITPASDKTKSPSVRITPPDLKVEAMLKGVQTEPNIIKFEKEAQNVVECLCQVFFHKIALNHWRAIVAFFPKLYKKEVNHFYQDSNYCPSFDIKFGGGVIKVSTDDTVPAGWEVTINQQQVFTIDVEKYAGEAKPQCCEMTLRADDAATDKESLFELPVTLTGIREQPCNKFSVKRVLERSHGVLLYNFQPTKDNLNSPFVCQVFYHKLRGINRWKVTLGFFTKNKMNRVKQLYQDANLGQTIEVEKFSKFDTGWPGGTVDVIEPRITVVKDGWNMTRHQIERIKRKTIVEYDGVDKPPCCVMMFEAVFDVKTPPDLTVTVILGKVETTNEFTIFRAAVAKTQELDQVSVSSHASSDDDITDDDDGDESQSNAALMRSIDSPGGIHTPPPIAHVTEKKQQKQFPMESENGFYYVNLEDARKYY